MIYDCFIFTNELELLEIRLNELYQIIDKFLIIEATKSHQGKEKPLYYEENKQRFKKFHNKIIHIVVNFPPDDILDQLNPLDFFLLNNENLTTEQKKTEILTKKALSRFSIGFIAQIVAKEDSIRLSWKREHYQRNMILSGLNCEPDDIVIISDLDEIPKADKISIYKDKPGIKIFKHKFYYDYINSERRVNINLSGSSSSFYASCSIMTHYKNITLPQALRILTHMPYNALPDYLDYINFIENGGWHFSHLRSANFDSDAIHLQTADTKNLFYFYCVPIDDSFPLYIRNNVNRFSDIICNNFY